MKLIRSFKKILLLVFLCSIIFPKTIKPNGKEDMLKLVIETNEGNKVRPYYMIDKDGLMYKDFKVLNLVIKLVFKLCQEPTWHQIVIQVKNFN